MEKDEDKRVAPGGRERPAETDGETRLRPISNRYVFAKVMQENPEICLRLAELLVGEPLGEIGEVVAESVENTLLARGVHFDAHLEGSDTLVYLEMQAGGLPSLELRDIYYRLLLVKRALREGYEHEPRRIVVLLCTSDPFEHGLPVYRIAFWIEDEADRTSAIRVEDGELSLLYNAAAHAEQDDPGIAAVLEYVHTGETGAAGAAGGLVADMEDARIRAHDDEEWVSDMDAADFDRYDIETKAYNEGHAEGMAEGRAAGVAEGAVAERSRESALFKAMTSKGRDAEEFLSAVTDGDLDALYREYGIA